MAVQAEWSAFRAAIVLARGSVSATAAWNSTRPPGRVERSSSHGFVAAVREREIGRDEAIMGGRRFRPEPEQALALWETIARAPQTPATGVAGRQSRVRMDGAPCRSMGCVSA